MLYTVQPQLSSSETQYINNDMFASSKSPSASFFCVDSFIYIDMSILTTYGKLLEFKTKPLEEKAKKT